MRLVTKRLFELLGEQKLVRIIFLLLTIFMDFVST